MLVLLGCLAGCASAVTLGPSPQAIALQKAIDRSIEKGERRLEIRAGDYYFGNASMIVHQASNFSLSAKAGPGTVQLWFAIGAGVLVNQSSDVVLDGFSIDYDPPAHYQGTIQKVISASSVIQATVKTDTGFLDPTVFDAEYRMGKPGVQSGPSALVWNSSDPGFGAFGSADWPPTATADGNHVFNVSRALLCKDIASATTDGSSCLAGSTIELQVNDKITAHIRKGFTLHIMNSTRVRTQHAALHGAPGFAITEYDGYGKHSYFNVSLGRRHTPPGGNASSELCGASNPTGGRLCLGLISSNNGKCGRPALVSSHLSLSSINRRPALVGVQAWPVVREWGAFVLSR